MTSALASSAADSFITLSVISQRISCYSNSDLLDNVACVVSRFSFVGKEIKNRHLIESCHTPLKCQLFNNL